MIIREYRENDLPDMIAIWNEVVEEGNAFPQENPFCCREEAASFFASQNRTAVADDDGKVAGLYILHPNNIGRCGHIANASYAVASSERGRGIGKALVLDSLSAAKALGFRILQYNAVVSTNLIARKLYQDLGFTSLGTIPGGFRRKDGSYEDIISYYRKTE